MKACYVDDWLLEERNYEIARLEAILRSNAGTAEDREIAQSQLDFYKSDLAEQS
jgi:hypothetical protein